MKSPQFCALLQCLYVLLPCFVFLAGTLYAHAYTSLGQQDNSHSDVTLSKGWNSCNWSISVYESRQSKTMLPRLESFYLRKRFACKGSLNGTRFKEEPTTHPVQLHLLAYSSYYMEAAGAAVIFVLVAACLRLQKSGIPDPETVDVDEKLTCSENDVCQPMLLVTSMDSEKSCETFLQEMDSQTKSTPQGLMDAKKWRKDDSVFDAFSKFTFNDIFKFRRDQVFKQTCTVSPATVNLVSHFASGTYGQPGSMQELKKEGVRLASFKDFPTFIPVSAMRLAQAGFHYTGERDVVKCFSCGVTYQGWQMGDRPTLVHARISPNCPFVQGSDTANLPLPPSITSRPDFAGARNLDSGYGSHSFGSSTGAPSSEMPNGTVNSGLHEDSDATTDRVRMPSSGPRAPGPSSLTTLVAAAASAGPIPSSLATSENSMFSGAPLFGRSTPMDGGAPRDQPMPTRRLELGGAVYPLYSQMDARRRSFCTWVADQGLPAVDELITLGFFYAGYADCVRCFFCGIGLKSWEPGDIPAEVHARWRPTCNYLRLVKGDEFVDQVANGGRNVASGENRPQAQDARAHHSLNLAPRRDAAQDPQANSSPTAPSTNTSQQGSAPSAAQVPDIPVVRRARETGYSDQQIAEGIEKLRIIGMERAIEVMLVEVLTNLFRDNPPQPRSNSGNSSQSDNSSHGGNSSLGTGTSDPEAPANGADLQSDDDAEPDNEVPDSGRQVGDDGNFRERHNRLQEENARLRNMRTCQRCHDRPVGVIFLPCGHIITCATCAPNVRRCLRCDTVIRATVNVIFS